MVRETAWASVDTSESVLSGAPTAVVINSAGAALLALRPFTVVRVRGIMHVRSDQAAASESFIADLGAAVVTDQAAAIGVTAVPTPLTDKSSDAWFVYEQIAGRIDIGSGAGTGPPSLTSTWMQYDSKAMRKVEQDFDIVFVAENEIAGCNLLHSARLLIKLH